MSSKRSKTDLLVRQRFINPLPPPAFPPKLLTIKTDPSRYTSYDFLVPLSMERVVPMIVDGEGGMHLDQLRVPGYFETKDGRSGKMVPDMVVHAPELDEEDLELLAEPSTSSSASTQAGILPANSGNNLDLIGSGGGIMGAANSPAAALDKRRKEVAFVKRTVIKNTANDAAAARQEAMAVPYASINPKLASRFLAADHPVQTDKQSSRQKLLLRNRSKLLLLPSPVSTFPWPKCDTQRSHISMQWRHTTSSLTNLSPQINTCCSNSPKTRTSGELEVR